MLMLAVQGAGIGDVFVSTGKLHHDRRIPLPGFDKQVSLPAPVDAVVCCDSKPAGMLGRRHG